MLFILQLSKRSFSKKTTMKYGFWSSHLHKMMNWHVWIWFEFVLCTYSASNAYFKWIIK